MKFPLLLLLLTFTDAKSLGHSVSSIRKTNFDGIQKMNRFARDVKCDKLTTEKPVDVIGACYALRAVPEYTLKVENVKGSKWNTFTSELYSLTNIILVIDGSDIEALKLDKFENIGGDKDITIKNNKDLKEISFTLSQNMNIGKLIIMDNEKLESIKIEPTKTFECTEIVISKNPMLKTLEFTGAATYTIPQLEIRQNIMLKTIGEIEKLKPDGNVVIEDNRLIEETYLSQIRNVHANWKIQPYGQCLFDKPIENLSELDSCVVVNQLKFAKGATGTITDLKLTTIEDGDIYLADVPWEKVRFLERVTNMAKITSEICEFPEINDIKVESPPCPTTTTESAIVASNPPSGAGSSSDSKGSGSKSSPSVSSSEEAARFTMGLIIIGGILGAALLTIVGGLIVTCIWYKKEKNPGRNYCSWLFCGNMGQSAARSKKSKSKK